MLRQTELAGRSETAFTRPTNTEPTGRTQRPELILPALDVSRTRAERAKQKQEIEALFPESTNLRGLIADIKSGHSEKFAEVTGSTDFAQERLAGLYAALERLAERIDAKELTSIEEVAEEVYSDTAIHEVFEDLVIRCARNSL